MNPTQNFELCKDLNIFRKLEKNETSQWPISAHDPVAQHRRGRLTQCKRPMALPARPYGPAVRCRLALRGAHGAPVRARVTASLRRQLGGVDEWCRGRGHGGGLTSEGEQLADGDCWQ
jgi:hypothetical protein